MYLFFVASKPDQEDTDCLPACLPQEIIAYILHFAVDALRVESGKLRSVTLVNQ